MTTISMKKVLAKRPPDIIKKLGTDSQICLLSSKDIFEILKDRMCIVMAANCRIKLSIPGLMKAAEELDAVIGFELARSEGGVDGGYTCQTPKDFFEAVTGYANKMNFTKPFFIHADHTTVKQNVPPAIQSAKELIDAQLEAGYTSFAIDASFNELPDNIRITAQLARPIIERDFGLEVEVGEIKSAGQEAEITTVEEAVTFISELDKLGVHPALLAINNGSKHGNYLAGEKIFIDLDRTGQIYEEVKVYGVSIAQHGITGTPLSLVGRFADYGIRKGNVGTEWQNIAHKCFPQVLMEKIKKWVEETGNDIKMSTKVFKKDIDNLDKKSKDKIADMTYQEAKEFIKAFRAEGTASIVCDALSK